MIKEVYACAVSDFVYITDNSYTEAEIRHMELRIIRANHLSPIFLRRYFKAGDVTAVVSEEKLGRRWHELGDLQRQMFEAKSKAYRFMDTVWTPTLELYSSYSAETVLDVLPKLVNNMVRMNRSRKFCPY